MTLKHGQEPQEVAIKRMSPQALQGLQNFQREARETEIDWRIRGGRGGLRRGVPYFFMVLL